MKPVKPDCLTSKHSQESRPFFNRASGGRPTPLGRGPWERPTYIRRDREARGPVHGSDRKPPRGPFLHRCMMESQEKRSGFTANDCAGFGNVFYLFQFFLFSVSLWKEIVAPASREHWGTVYPNGSYNILPKVTPRFLLVYPTKVEVHVIFCLLHAYVCF